MKYESNSSLPGFAPIYTEKTECQDCYKCVRGCPVKAIKIENGRAMVIHEECILCGNCVETCPVGAKKVRDDLNRVKQLLKLKEQVYVSLAPSWISEFNGISEQGIISALKKLGFSGVSETALGAQEVSSHAAELLASNKHRVLISTACPTVVDLIEKYHPELCSALTPLLSPALTHARMLRQTYGDKIGVVFIGPCIAKKQEAERHHELIDLSISFADLRRWFEREELDLDSAADPAEEAHFVPERAHEGALYPVDGGMIAGIKADHSGTETCFMTFSGISQIRKAFEELEQLPEDTNLFLELLACEGGCINGPQGGNRVASALKRYKVISETKMPADSYPRKPQFDISEQYLNRRQPESSYSAGQIREGLYRIGKYSAKDELNCSGCGYESCRDFVHALLDGKAEKTMCVSYMRKMAQKKANALIKTMPSGMVIIDDEMRIVECNQKFAVMMGEDIELMYEAKPGLEGASAEKIIPFHNLFRNVLEIGEEILDRDVRVEKQVLHLSIFNLEKHHFVGGIIQDVTTPSVQKEQIVTKAKQVIEHNLETVQKIAYLLGENASETEVILDSIVQSFDPNADDEHGAI